MAHSTDEHKQKRIVDFQRFGLGFLLLSIFLSIGWLIPGHVEVMMSGLAITIWYGTIIMAAACIMLSAKWKQETEKG